MFPKDMELWPMVLEKAYAKLHHNWDAIDGGFAGQAVKDMTGRDAAVTAFGEPRGWWKPGRSTDKIWINGDY